MKSHYKIIDLRAIRVGVFPMVMAFLLAAITFTASAQEVSLSGTVVSESDKMGLPGVNVIVKGTSIGTVTDIDGKFTLAAPEDASVLVFSFMGMEQQEVEIGSTTTFNIEMKEDVQALEEVVVVGYGVEKKRVLTGAVSSVSAEAITQTPITRAEEALQGRSAGVMVTSESGQPGAGISVRIRGTGSNKDSDPLYVVDGVQLKDISFLNPSDIESIDVLKDATAGIYGARGANGVVFITTKKGSRDGKMVVTYDGYYGVQNPWKKVSTLNTKEWMVMHNEAELNDGLSPIFTQDQINSDTTSTDWQDALFNRNAPMTSHSVSLSGGNEKSNFLAGVSYFGQEGIVGGDKSFYDRITVRLNSDHQISKYFSMGQTLSLVHTNKSSISDQSEFGSILQSAIIHDPLTRTIETDSGRIARYKEFETPPATDANGNYYGISDQGLREIWNPLARIENTFGENKEYLAIGNMYAAVEPIQGLKLKTDLSVNIGNQMRRNYTPKGYYNTTSSTLNTSVSQGSMTWSTVQWENVLSYNKSFGDHNVSGILGTTALRSEGRDQNSSRSTLVPDGWDYAWVNNGADDDTQKGSGYPWQNSLLSYFGRVAYNFQDKYMVSFLGRYDGSSRFGPDKKFAFFPTVSAGWVITEESFFPKSAAFSFLKLRGSWGQTGNENIDNFGYLSTVGKTYAYPLGATKTATQGSAVLRASNPELQWEASEQSNIGLDFGFIKDKLLLTVEYYDKTTQGLLSSQPIPSYTGLQDPLANIGTVQNSGYEASISYRKREGEFNFDVSANVSYNQNKVTSVKNANGYINGFTPFGHEGNQRMEEGQPMAFFYGFETAGIFQSQAEIDAYQGAEGELIQPNAKPGDIKFVDYNNDGKIDADDRTNIGNAVPVWVYGGTFNASFKGFDMSMFWQGQGGHKIANIMRRQDLMLQNYSAKALDRWTGEGSTNDYPRATHKDENKNYTRLNNIVHLEDATYLRLKNLQFGYTLPKDISLKAGMSRARVYVSFNNLLTFTNYSGFDPEIGGGDILTYGFDRGAYPQAQSTMLGLNLTF